MRNDWNQCVHYICTKMLLRFYLNMNFYEEAKSRHYGTEMIEYNEPQMLYLYLDYCIWSVSVATPYPQALSGHCGK